MKVESHTARTLYFLSLFLSLSIYISFVDVFNATATLVEEQWWYYSNHSWKYNLVDAYPKAVG